MLITLEKVTCWELLCLSWLAIFPLTEDRTCFRVYLLCFSFHLLFEIVFLKKLLIRISLCYSSWFHFCVGFWKWQSTCLKKNMKKTFQKQRQQQDINACGWLAISLEKYQMHHKAHLQGEEGKEALQ